jgi:hypothetical protein
MLSAEIWLLKKKELWWKKGGPQEMKVFLDKFLKTKGWENRSG